MTFYAFVLILCSTVLHLTWNTLSKSGRPSIAFYVLMSGMAALLWLPFFCSSTLQLATLPLHFYFLAGGSILGQALYILGLGHAYKRGDISLVYPLLRALPVLLLALLSFFLKNSEPLNYPKMFGILVIVAGCLLIPLPSLRDFSLQRYQSPILGFILLGALGTTAYTLFDNECVLLLQRHTGAASTINTLGYLFLIELSQAFVELLYVLSRQEERQALWEILTTRISWKPLVAGCCSSGGYAMILLAMSHVTNISILQAFRQISLPLSLFVGALFLHEKITAAKWIGMALVLFGLLTITLG